MGYLGNHLATIVTGVFATILTALWPIFIDFAPVTDFIFIMAVPIMWFLVFTCWIAQKSADYMHAGHKEDDKQQIVVSSAGSQHSEKKNLNESNANTATDTQNEISNLQNVQNELLADVNGLKESLKLKDSEIERLNKQIANLKTRVQIETLRAELANLKMLASKQKK